MKCVYSTYRSSIHVNTKRGIIIPQMHVHVHHESCKNNDCLRELILWLIEDISLTVRDKRYIRDLSREVKKNPLSDEKQKRLKQIASISLPMSTDAMDAALRIRSHREFFVYAWRAIGRILASQMRKIKKIDIFAFADIIKKLGTLSNTFERITTYPFKLYATLILQDIASAMRACAQFEISDTRTYLKRARSRMKWIFLLHKLYKEIVIPLTFFLTRALLRIRRNSVTWTERVKLFREFDAVKYAALRKKVHVFPSTLSLVSDLAVIKPMKHKLNTLLTSAKVYMDAYDWPRALLALVRAARLISTNPS